MEGEADGNQMFGGHLSDTSEQFVLSDYPCDQSGRLTSLGREADLAGSTQNGEDRRGVKGCVCLPVLGKYFWRKLMSPVETAAWDTCADGSGMMTLKGPRAGTAKQLQNAVCASHRPHRETCDGPRVFCRKQMPRAVLDAGLASPGGVARWQVKTSCLAILPAPRGSQ